VRGRPRAPIRGSSSRTVSEKAAVQVHDAFRLTQRGQKSCHVRTVGIHPRKLGSPIPVCVDSPRGVGKDHRGAPQKCGRRARRGTVENGAATKDAVVLPAVMRSRGRGTGGVEDTLPAPRRGSAFDSSGQMSPTRVQRTFWQSLHASRPGTRSGFRDHSACDAQPASAELDGPTRSIACSKQRRARRA